MQPDGTVLIDTEIDTDGMKPGTKEVEDAVRRMAGEIDDLGKKAEIALQKQVASFAKANNAFQAQQKKVDELKRKIEEYGNTKIPTEQYSSLDKELARLGAEYDKIAEKQSRFLETGGKEGSTAYKRMEYDLDALDKKQDEVIAKMKSMEESGQAFTLGKDTDQYSAMIDKYVAESQKLLNMNENLGASYSRIKNEFTEYQNRLSDVTDSHTQTADSVDRYRVDLLSVDSAQRKAEKSGKKFSKALDNTKKSAKGAGINLKKVLLYGLGVESLFTLLSRMRGNLKEGMDNLARYSNDTNAALSMLMSSMTQLKNSFAVAFSPVVEFVAPTLEKFITLLAEAGNRVSELFAALMGKDTFTKAVKVQQDYAESLDKTSDGLKDAAKEAKKAIAPFDDLRQIQFPDEKKNLDKNELNPSEMFEDMEVSTDAKNMAEKVKETLHGLFDPIKESWLDNGPYVVEAFKYAASAIKQLAADMGASFMQVWNAEGYGKAITDDLLITFGNLLMTVGNLVTQFDKAWVSGETGTNILRHLGDIILEITGFFREASESLMNWSATLNFSPLLESFDRVLVAIRPIVSDVGDLLLWLLNNVLLPIAKWGIEQLLPQAFNLIAAALTVLHSIIEALKPLGIWLWENFLLPLGQWAGEKIIEALERITEKLYIFSNWIDQNQEKVRTATIVILGFFAAFSAVTFIANITSVISALGKLVSVSGTASTLLKAIGTAFSFLISPAGIAAIAIGAITAAIVYLIATNEELREKFVDAYENHIKPVLESLGARFKEIMEGPVKEAVESVINLVDKLWNEVLKPFLEWIITDTLPVIAPIIEGIGNVFLDVFEGIALVISGLSDALAGLIDFIAGVFSGDWERAWNGIKAVFDGVWRAILGTLETIGSVILDTVNGIIKTIKEAINAVNNLLSSGHGDKSFNSGGVRGEISHKRSYQAVTPMAAYAAIPYNPPMLATGTVVPPRAGISYFGIGDNNKEPEVISPLSTMVEAFKQAMAESGFNGTRPINIEMQVKGQTFARLVYQMNNEEQQRVGVRMVTQNG